MDRKSSLDELVSVLASHLGDIPTEDACKLLNTIAKTYERVDNVQDENSENPARK